jgi:cytoskeletal protein CcmA (bactofilin family)
MMNPLLFIKGFYIPVGVEVNGDFFSDKEGGIAGTINGDVKIKASLFVQKQGVINGDLHATDAIIKGRVNGNIYCRGKVTTLKDAVISGNIHAAEARIDKLSIVKGVFAHLHQKKNRETNGTPEETEPETIAISEDFLPDEPQQNWF